MTIPPVWHQTCESIELDAPRWHQRGGIQVLTGCVVTVCGSRHPLDVPRSAKIPAQLKHAPFSLEEARAAGLTLSSLKSQEWKRLGSELYCWRGLPPDPWLILDAWRRLLGDTVTFSSRSAAWLHGLDVNPVNPVAVTAPSDSALRSCHGLTVRRCDLGTDEVVTARGLRGTSIHRTLRDICLGEPPVEALVTLDSALRSRIADREALWRYALSVNGLPGSRRMRQLIPLVEPAESPMETRLRWLFIQAGLPRPQVQAELFDSAEQFIARVDLYYPNASLVIEFDGGIHREHLVADARRQNQLINAGFTVLRFTGPDLNYRPEHVVAEVRHALAAAADSARLVPAGRLTPRRSARLVPNGR